MVQKLDDLKALGHPPEAGHSAPIDETYYTPPAGETSDPAMWTWTPADRYFMEVFLRECKKRGLRVTLDGVWNHTGREFWTFEDLRKNGRQSPYASWNQAEFDQRGKLVGWSGWENKDGYLPEFRRVKRTGRDWDMTVEKGDLNAGAKEHIVAITKRWVDPNGDGDPSDGSDGWRLDVVPDVGMTFWHSWRAHVRSINPDAIVVCEVWPDADEYVNPDKDGNPPPFDTQMHFPFVFPALEWLAMFGDAPE